MKNKRLLTPWKWLTDRTVDVVLIEYPDLLVRFGFGYPEEGLSWKRVRLDVLDLPK